MKKNSNLKKQARKRRACKIKSRISRSGLHRLCVYRTPRHIYAQIISVKDSKVLLSVSSLSKEICGSLKNGGNIQAACEVGRVLGERAKKLGLDKVGFDRAGYKYHGRVKALAESAREQGMVF